MFTVQRNNFNVVLKMLGLYLDTLIIGQTFCSMLSKLTLQRDI